MFCGMVRKCTKKFGVCLVICLIVWLSGKIWHELTLPKSTKVYSSELDGRGVHQFGNTGDGQSTLDYIGEFLLVHVDVVSNFHASGQFLLTINLTNAGGLNIGYGDWQIYFYLVGEIQPNSHKNGTRVGRGLFTIFHVNGDLYRMKPTKQFTVLARRGKLTITLAANGQCTTRSYIMPNWYVAGVGNLRPQLLKSTKDDSKFVAAFDKPAKWKNHQLDLHNPFTPEERFERYLVEDLNHAPLAVLPQPWKIQKLSSASKTFTGSGWSIVADDSLVNEVDYLTTNLDVRLEKKSTVPKEKYIHLAIVEVNDIDLTNSSINKNESYLLMTDPKTESIFIKSTTAAGVFMGIQSLLMIMRINKTLPHLQIIDGPRYQYRGLMLDVARHFFPKDIVFKVLDTMAMFKMNKLHLHLTDDEGWRLEIPGLPELTSIGGKRSHDLTGDISLLPAYGSGPHDDTSGSGYYSTADYKEILARAKKLHIQIIPEIDMPGHCKAAIVSMEARYRRLLKAGSEKEASKYMISDVNDTSSYESVQRHYNNALNPCLESTYIFISHIMSTLVTLHADISPLTVYHFGGDEVPRQAYNGSPACQKMMKEKDLAHKKELKQYFVQRIARIAKKLQVDLQGWEDGFFTDAAFSIKTFPNNKAYVNGWLNVWGAQTEHRAYQFANSGYNVIMSQATHLYLDHPQEPDPEERGLFWATRFTDTRKCYSFMPERVYENMDFTIIGDPLDSEKECKDGRTTCLDLKNPENIIGMQGSLWSEHVHNADHVFEMLLPRLIAIAERSWHRASWELEKKKHTLQRLRNQDWTNFANTLGYTVYPILSQLNINAYIPPPGVRYANGRVEANVQYPGLKIQYSLDKGSKWKDFSDKDTSLSGNVTFATRWPSGTRRSRPISVTLPG